MARKKTLWRINRKIGRFRFEQRMTLLLVAGCLAWAGYSWIKAHPEHDPSAPLDLRHPVGWATSTKIAALKTDVPECRAVLERSEVDFTILAPEGEGACERPDRTQLADFPLSPQTPPTTCPVATAMELWLEKTVQPLAKEIFGSEVVRIEHLGAYSCRRLYGREEGAWSEHATGNAIDIAGFILEDGTRISVLADWNGSDQKQRFLREVRNGACSVFAAVLSPEYNSAHADHFHFDQAGRWSGVCR